MTNTNINGYMYTAQAVLNAGGRVAHKSGTFINITSTTALEAPPFPGESVYHANKACQEAFTNALRNQLAGTNTRVLALRPGVVNTHFHRQRVGYGGKLHGEFMEGFPPLLEDDVAAAAIFMVKQPECVSIKALDVNPTHECGWADDSWPVAQRSLSVFGRDWNKRNEVVLDE
ncbi:hypothetical protein IAR50_005623 [Cryptococcus sp. DSM 104548]